MINLHINTAIKPSVVNTAIDQNSVDKSWPILSIDSWFLTTIGVK